MHKKRMTFSTVSLTRAFPLSCRRHERHSDCDLHSHAFHELVVVLNGSGRHLTAHGDYEISVGDVFMVRGAMEHGYAHSREVSLVNILFEPRLLQLPMRYLDDLPGYHALFRIEPRLRRHPLFRPRLRLQPDELADAASIIARMEQELERKAQGYRFSACIQLMELISFLARCYFRAPSPEPTGESLQKFSEALSHIDRYYDRPIKVADLAGIAGMSDSTLTRAFHRIMGRSPMKHVIHVRIGRARELLKRPDTRITEVAFACGFGDSNYFSRQFRKHTKMSPRAYQRRVRLGLEP